VVKFFIHTVVAQASARKSIFNHEARLRRGHEQTRIIKAIPALSVIPSLPYR
jgi:hypothetical protein